jgi:quercetin dioxygenase-like cupin family protein
MPTPIPLAEPVWLASLLAPSARTVASRVLATRTGGTLTLLAFGAGQDLAAHASPVEAFAVVIDGHLVVRIDGTSIDAAAGTIVRLPANVRHSLTATASAHVLLVVLRDDAARETEASR